MSRSTNELGWRIFGQYSDFLGDKKTPVCLKRTILNSVILPTLSSGVETWSLIRRQAEKLAVAQRSMERSILNVTRRDKIHNEIIRGRTKIRDVVETTIEKKSRWAGHVARMRSERWAKVTTEWTPRESKRTRG